MQTQCRTLREAGVSLASLFGVLGLLLIGASPALGQGGTVTGIVTDRGGDALAGVQLMIQGKLATVTGADGRFVIRNLPGGSYTLQARRIGHRTENKAINLAAGATLEVEFTLGLSAVSLDEFVVTGTGGEVEKRKLGVNLETFDMAARVQEVTPLTDFGTALGGRIAGVRSIASTGGVGAGRDLRIRGTSSFSLGQRPIVYIDGVRVDRRTTEWGNMAGNACCSFSGGAGEDRLNDLNPNEIERIEILKGAAAATLYGSEATNGVIQIFTKKGRTNQRTTWAASVNLGFNRARPNFETKLYPNFTGPDGTVGKDANKTLIENGLYQDYELSASGGGENIMYFASAGWLSEEGSIKPNSMNRGNMRLNLGWTVTPKLTVEARSSYVKNRVEALQSGNNWTALLGNAILGNPRLATKDRAYGEPWVTIEAIKAMKTFSDVNRFMGGITLSYTSSANFTNRVTVGLDQLTDEKEKLLPFGFFYTGVNRVGERDLGYRSVRNITADYLGRLSLTLGSEVESELSWGAQGFWEVDRRNMAVGRGYAGPGVTTVGGAADTFADEFFQETINVGVFLQNRFSLWDKIFVTGGVRGDGNSAFGVNYGLRTYPKADIAYLLSQEGFLPGFVSNLKLRGAIGFSGLAPGAYDQFTTFEAVTAGDDLPGALPLNPGNPALKPELTREFQGGVDLGLFDDRIGIEFTAYHALTTDGLLPIPLPASQGFSQAQLQNVGKVLNTGWEVSLNATPVDAAGFRWSTDVRLDGNHNEILELGPAAACGVSALDGVEYCRLGNHRTNHAVGAEFQLVILSYNAATNTHTRSDTTLFVGNPMPNFNASWGNTIQLGAFRLYGLLIAEKGAVFRNTDRDFATRFETGDRYLSELDANGNRTRTSDSLLNYHTLINSYHERDHIRLRELTLSYEVPQGLSAKLGLGRTNVQLSGQNLHWWDHCLCRDPGAKYAGGDDRNFSGFLAQPTPRKFVFALRTAF